MASKHYVGRSYAKQGVYQIKFLGWYNDIVVELNDPVERALKRGQRLRFDFSNITNRGSPFFWDWVAAMGFRHYKTDAKFYDFMTNRIEVRHGLEPPKGLERLVWWQEKLAEVKDKPPRKDTS